MDENNPLFDLCKIRVELIFLNEKNIPKINFYENSLVFYLNKYLYKISSENQNQNNLQNKFELYFFEFYTKHLNIKSSNIPDANLLSNTTDFFCNILIIFEQKEKDKLLNMIKNSNTPKELSYTLIFCDKNLELNIQNDDFNLDKNSYDIIEIWTNNNDIKKCHPNLENALKNIIIKYRINQLNKKLDISINKNEDENKDKNDNEKDNNVDDAKIKEKLEILEIYIKLGDYQKSIEYLNILKESFIVPKELAKFNECEIIINFLISYKNNNKLEYDQKIEEGFLDVISNYKNLRQINLMINAYLKLLYYLSYFDTKKIKQRINEIVDKIFCEKFGEKLNTNILFLVYLNISHIFNKMNLKRKFFIFIFLAYKDYSNTEKNIDINKNVNYFNLLIKYIEKYCFNKNNSLISNYYEYNYEKFLELSNIIRLSQYKPNKYTFINNKENIIEENNDINMINRRLIVNNIYSGYYQIFHITKWEWIQKHIYIQLIEYYKNIKDYDKTILYCLELLQMCHNILSIDKQNEIINIIKKKSRKIKYINYFNVGKLPIIIKFIPQRSKIKFDYQEKNDNIKENDLFIFNPWNQKKDNNINYYWTLNSTQVIFIRFYNPLRVPIFINNIQLLYTTKNKEQKNINCFNYSPSTLNISPGQEIEYEFKLKSLVEDIYNIIGIEYIFEGIKIRQYIKNDGNGIYYRYNNQIVNLYNSKLKDKINLDNIRIYPEIPQIKLIPINQELSNERPLSLFEFQKYIFNFDIINNSEKYIKQINVAVYAYKKDDYKITLYETEIKGDKEKYYLEPRNDKKYSYEFIQKKSYLKIEFIIYYTFKKDEDNKNIIKPYLFFKKDLDYKKLFTFSNPDIIPIHNNPNLEKILSMEKMYSKYITFIIGNNYYFSFLMEMRHFTNKNISYEIINKDISIENGEFINKKNFIIFLDKKEKLSRAYIKWKINDDINGIINCFDLIRNIFKIEIVQNFDFDIKLINKEEYIQIEYQIKNNTKFSFYNMKMKILLYQENNQNINLNFHLENDIFIEGKLIYLIEEIKPKEIFKNSIKIYPVKDINFNTTFLLIDQKLKLLYVPSFSVKY